MSSAIAISSVAVSLDDLETVIVVPDIAVQEAGYIKTFTVKDYGHAKHEYHALAQMVYFQFQDDELEVKEVNSPLTITCAAEKCQMDGGLILYRAISGAIHVLGNGRQSRKKLLEAAYRYCTRWVRLDI